RTKISLHKISRPATLISFLLLSLLFTACGPQNGDEPSPKAIGLELVAEGLTSPVTLVEPPDDSGRLFIVDQVGLIYILTPDGTLLDEPFLDLRDQIVNLNEGYDERGLLGLAFHPNYAENGRFFVYYSAPLRPEARGGFNHTSIISEFRVSDNDPNKADPNSEQILLQVDQPQANHNGGTLAFGPDDGYFYISLGDGGNRDDQGVGHVNDWYEANPESGNGQDITQNLLGSILRIDIDSGDTYGIPPDNPFVDGEGLDEIFAYGFRNPYRFSFDMGGDHDLFVGDAGQELWEEVSIVTKGGNYGWNVKEGAHCFDAENPTQVPDECPDTVGEGHPRTGDPLIDPVIEFANSTQPDGLGVTVVGGYVYRGDNLPQLEGQYLFAVWSESMSSPAGAVFKAEPQSGSGLWDFEQLKFADTPELQHYVLGFGQDSEGEVYVLTTDNTGPSGNTGKVFKLVEGN
ncbi:MAG TPA: PQQ-dependent sugar dehydrogenase, partial [Balneolaceae bacterium]|nr:PQQ-dependent sugar dehydrogenase [Balneolaceae bacterium]